MPGISVYQGTAFSFGLPFVSKYSNSLLAFGSKCHAAASRPSIEYNQCPRIRADINLRNMAVKELRVLRAYNISLRDEQTIYVGTYDR